MGQKPTAIPSPTPPTKEQRLELIARRLVPGHLIPTMSREQAEKLIRKNRLRLALRKTVVTLVFGIVALCGGFLAFEGWKKWSESKAPKPQPAPGIAEKIPEKRELTSWSMGDWEPWIRDPKVIVVSDLPDETKVQLRKQIDLFLSVLQEHEAAAGEPSFSSRFESMREEFPSGENVSASYSSASSRTSGHASENFASAGGSGYRTHSGTGSVGVRDSLLSHYRARVKVMTEEGALEQLEAIEKRLNRDIEELEGRRVAGGRLGAETEASLRWLKNDLRPYVKKFRQFLENEIDASRPDPWESFEKSDKPRMEDMIDRLTTEVIPLEQGQAVVPAGHEVLLDATVGTRRMVFLPGGRSEISIETEPLPKD